MRRPIPHLLFLAAALSVSVALPACGGGGGSTQHDASSDGAELEASVDAPSDAATSTPDAHDSGATDATAVDSGAAHDAGADASPVDASVHDAAVDAPFVEAPHQLPVIPDHGGPVIASPQLVTITWADDPHRAMEETLDGYLVTSPWLGVVGKEYGVGPGTNQNVEMMQNAPAMIDDTGIQTLIASLITSGQAPDPIADAGAGTFSPAIYMLFIPSTTTENFGTMGLCSFSAGAYHDESSVKVNGHTFAYAISSECPPITYPSDVEWNASHEFIEACTDPYPNSAPAYRITDPNQVWSTIGGEVGDLCSFLTPQWAEGSYTTLQRTYSNAAAQDGGSPCPPNPEPYYGTDIQPMTYVPLAAGQTTTFPVKGWSTAPVPAWAIYASSADVSGTAKPTLALGAMTMQNGGSTTLTVTMPAGAASQTYVNVYVGSSLSANDYTYSAVGVYVP